MIFQGKYYNIPISISVKPNCLTLSYEMLHHTDVFSFDYEGRMWTSLVDEVSYRRGLDGKTVAKWISPNGERHRKWLTPENADSLAEKAKNRAFELLQAYEHGSLWFNPQFSNLGLEGLKKAAAFNRECRLENIKRYQEIYLPVGILPPDQYGAVVLQATEGCSFNACTFCSFYKDRRFKIKSTTEFEDHCVKVTRFLGKGLSLRRTIFLGDANALVAPMTRLISLLEITHRYFDIKQIGGIYAFLDGISGEQKDHHDYAKLEELGVERVYIGLESGSALLLDYLNKPSSPQTVVNTVRHMKKGHIAVGIIVLLGAGGKRYANEHVRETIRVLNSMKLDMDDIIYFSELIENEGVDYAKTAFEDQLAPLTPEERMQQGELIEKGLKFNATKGTPHISRYDIREFVY